MPDRGTSERSLIAVTGANGFVGQALCADLTRSGHAVRPLVRTLAAGPAAAASSTDGTVIVGDIHSGTDWSIALQGVHCVVHCAARVHVMHETAADPLTQFRAVNTEGTRALARQAAAAGVRRLVYVSSIKVLGEHSEPRRPFTTDSPADPQDPYGQSKWEAEQALHQLARETGLEVVVVRPPLVYGPGVAGNFRQLVRLVASGIPLPLGAIDNRRSLIALDNLVSLLRLCVGHSAAPGQTFLASDGDAPSTPRLVQGLATAMGRQARLWPVPVAWLMAAGRLTGHRAQVERLVQSLEVDDRHTRRELGWAPGVTFEEGLRRAVGSAMP